jgi:dolichol-phosphate mannosyltransferase
LVGDNNKAIVAILQNSQRLGYTREDPESFNQKSVVRVVGVEDAIAVEENAFVHSPQISAIGAFFISFGVYSFPVSNALVITPTFNERENIHSIIEAVFAQPKDFHMLIVDDGSPDGTAAIVKELQAKFNTSETRLHLLERKGKLGLGTAYIEGFWFGLRNGYDYILEMDADFSHDPKDLNYLYLACAENGADLAIGSRYITGVNVVNWPMSRVLLSYFASAYVRLVTGMTIRDTTAGFVCYRRKVLETLPLDNIKAIGYGFQIEMKFNTWKFGFTIREVPIIFTERVKGQSKLSAGIFKEALLGVVMLKVRSWFKNYKRPAFNPGTKVPA